MAEKRRLKSGFTTGTAAAAAAGGALRLLLEGVSPAAIKVLLLNGETLPIGLSACGALDGGGAFCTVIKDAGDDPDVTHRAEIGARVFRLPAGEAGGVVITGGEGVGTVTKPGLEVPVGEAAINPGPRRMITETVTALLAFAGEKGGVRVEIFVPKGRELAERTLNARLGILGGISILGTTGIVRPMSHDAYIATIRSAMAVARAAGISRVVLTTGRRSEKFAQKRFSHLPEEAFIQVGDFFRLSLETAGETGFSEAILAVFFGKAIKMAQGVAHTHAAKSSLSLEKLSGWTREVTKDPGLAEAVRNANTGRQAFFLLMERAPAVIDHVGKMMRASARGFAGERLRVRAVIFDFDGEAVFDSKELPEGVTKR